MTLEQIKITVPDVTTRTWTTLEEIRKTFTETEIVTMIHRYCDTQDHAKNYRHRAAERTKLMKSMLESQGISVKDLLA